VTFPATVGGTPVLDGLTLEVGAGEVHAIMGPNGAGKSTLAYVLGGRPGYEVTGGSVTFTPPVRGELVEPVRGELVEPVRGELVEQRDGAAPASGPSTRSGRTEVGEAVNLLALEPHERAAAGLFLGFQYPVEIPGVSNVQFLREALNSQRKARGQEPLSGGEFLKLAREKAALLKLDMEMLKRAVNVGFSGGEKKRAEMVQMGILDPKFAVLDETDSGLDIDALRVVGEGIKVIMRQPSKGVLLITHYQRLLDYVQPDFVHVMSKGRIVKTGGPELAVQLESEGYEAVAA